MEKTAIIDVGSNNMRMLIADVNDEGYFKVFDELKLNVRLISNMKDNELSLEKIDSAIFSLKLFKNFCEEVCVNTIIIIATEAIRRASNSDIFIKRVKDELNLNLKVLTEEEEIYLDFQGIKNTMYLKNSLIFDIGGAGSELLWIVDNELIKYEFFHFGALTLSEKFNLMDIITNENEENLKEFIIDHFSNIPWIKDGKFDEVIGIGGSLRSLSKIDKRLKRQGLNTFHNYKMDLQDVKDIYYMLKSKGLRQRMKISGLSNDRADLIVAPCAILLILMKLIDIDSFKVSENGLREGILYNEIHKNFKVSKDPLQYSLDRIFSHQNIDKAHSYKVYNLTLVLFEKLSSLHHLNGEFNNIIKVSCLLHDVGMNINYINHNKHAMYIILNSEINGLTHKELLMSAICASMHNDSSIHDFNHFQYSLIINKLDIMNVQKIAALIQIAENLDKSSKGLVKDLAVSILEDKVVIKAISDSELFLELETIRNSHDLFIEAYDLELIVK